MVSSINPEQTYASMEDYLKQLEERREMEEVPTAAIFLLESERLLMLDVNGLPWVNRVRCELPSRPTGQGGIEEPTVATYVTGYGGSKYGDEVSQMRYDLCKQRLGRIGISRVHRIRLGAKGSFSGKILKGLEKSDLILMDFPTKGADELGMDQDTAWLQLGPPENGGRPEHFAERIRWRYWQGAVLIGMGGGASILGELGVILDRDGKCKTFKPFEIVPAIIGVDQELLTQASVDAVGDTLAFVLPPGGGLIYNTDGSVEPVHGLVTELTSKWNKKEEDEVQTAYLAPPKTEENIMVCTKWLQDRGMTSVADVEEGDLEEGEDSREPTEGELHLGLEPQTIDEQALAKASETSDEHRRKGVEYFKSSEYESALAEFESALEANPYGIESYLNKSLSLLKLDRCLEALMAADAALWLSDGSNPKAWFRRAQAFDKAGEFNEAIADLEASIALAPGDKGILKLKNKGKEDRENGCWTYSSDCKKKNVESALLMEELEAFDGSVIELHDGELTYEWPAENDKNSPERRTLGTNLDLRALWVFQETTKSKYLNRLSLKGCRLGPWGANFIAKGARDAADDLCSNIQYLCLESCRLRDDGCGSIANLISRGVPLIELNLSDNGISGVGLRHLADALSEDDETQTLEVIDLSKNRIGDKGMGAFGNAVVKSSSIRSLNLSHNRISFRGVISICEKVVKRSKTLEHLYLAHNRKLRVDALWRLAGVGVGHESLKLIDLRGMKLTRGDWNEMLEKTKYTSLQFKLSRPPEVAADEAVALAKSGLAVEQVEEDEEGGKIDKKMKEDVGSMSWQEEKKTEENDNKNWLDKIPRLGLF